LVTPEQAELLSLASNETRIQLVLRNPLDTEMAKTSGIAMAGLFSDGNPPPKPKEVRKAPPRIVQAAPPPPRIYLVQILNGSKKSEEKFGETETPK
jgi:pilus assembly protein CpaB